MFGYQLSEAIGMHLGDLIPQSARQAHQQYVRAFGVTGTTTRTMHGGTAPQGLRRDGSVFPIEASISYIKVDGQALYTAVVRDVSARRQLEAQFLRAQKMELLGRLAGGIAHDFNNLLTVIQGYADFARDTLPGDSGVHADLGLITDSAKKASVLTRQLLAFARQQPLSSRPVDVNQVIHGLVKLLDRPLGTDIAVVTEMAPGALYVYGDPGQLEQVLVNLCINARDAMPDGGTITLTTAAVGYATIRVSVRDTGTGIPKEIQAQIFDPFFTTKPAGQGTGLGLATCYSIVTQHGGTISCTSLESHGSTFTIDLPRFITPGGHIPDETEHPTLPTGTETILLVEDEPDVRSMTARVLRRCGYQLIEAQNGAEALLRARQHARGAIDLLLTDMVMPGMGGIAIAEQLRRENSSLPVLLMSANHSGQARDYPFLQKPFAASELAQAVRAVLDGGTQSSKQERTAGS